MKSIWVSTVSWSGNEVIIFDVLETLFKLGIYLILLFFCIVAMYVFFPNLTIALGVIIIVGVLVEIYQRKYSSHK